ncbi:MAG: glycosyltransferase family 9 protein [Candidatus Coatesbacteria bacterium]|nr:glycosyltransferase family 9 protein [Candidatus Coatesbacteria bacterium]
MAYYRPMKTHRFLVIKLGSIGDVVHALPAVALLRRFFPAAEIDWLIEPKSAPILRGNPHISSALVVDTKKWRRDATSHPFRAASGLQRTYADLRARRYDVAIDYQGLIKSGMFAWASKARLRFGFPARECREQLNALFTNRKCWQTLDATHVIEKLCAITWGVAEELGKVEPQMSTEWCGGAESSISADETNKARFRAFVADKGVAENDCLIAVNPCAGWVTKRWSASNFARMMRLLRASDAEGRRFRFMLLYGPNEQHYAQNVLDELGQEGAAGAFLAPPSDIPTLCAILDACDVVVTGDTAILHIAAALNRPTVALFGPSDPYRNGPFGNPHIVVRRETVCGPCYKRECDSMECIEKIGPEEVAQAVRALAQRAIKKSGAQT